MEVLLALVLLAILAMAFLVAVFFLFIHPIWGIVDCAVDERKEGAEKALWIILMLIMWSLGSIIYGLFGSRTIYTKTTRYFVGISAVFVVIVTATAVLFPRMMENLPDSIEERISRGEPSAAVEEPVTTALPGEISIDPFHAVHFVPTSPTRGTAALARFDASGLIADSALPVTTPSSPLHQIAIDAAGPVYYGITTHEIGRIVPSTGVFVEMEIDPALPELSWPSGITFDSSNRRLIVTARSGAYSWDPATGDWQRVPGLEALDVSALAYAPERETLFAALDEPGSDRLETIVEVNPEGAVIESIPLSTPIRIGRQPVRGIQLAWSNGSLILLSSARLELERGGGEVRREARTYVVDPDSGNVRLLTGPPVPEEG